jgi:hypothetical protein
VSTVLVGVTHVVKFDRVDDFFGEISPIAFSIKLAILFEDIQKETEG